MIGILGAMDVEIEAILTHTQVKEIHDNNGLPMYYGTIEGKDVVIAKTGCGTIYASMITTQLLERNPITALVNIGTAGGLKEEENVLDVIISDRVTKHDFDTSTVFNTPVGFNEGNPHIYKADTQLVDVAVKTMESLSDSRVFVGDIVSGDRFICKKEDVDYITTHFPSALCGDMEAVSVGQVAKQYGVPFVVVRSLSDITVKEGNEMQFEQYVALASKRSADFVKEFIKALK